LPYIASIYKNISINIDSGPNQPFYFCFEDYCTPPYLSNQMNNIQSFSYNNSCSDFSKRNVKNIKIVYPREYPNFKDSINYISLHVDFKNYYYNKEDIKKFKIQDNQEEKYIEIILPKIDNYKGSINHIYTSVMSLFYNWSQYIFFYLFLICAGGIYIFNKEILDIHNIKQKFKEDKILYISLFLITLLALFLRLVNFTYTPLWVDEIYTKIIAANNFISTYKDPGNPPLFFMVELIFTKLFSSSVFILRLPSLIFGIALPAIIYFIFKDISKKLALFASFLTSINIISVYLSQEARSGSMCLFLVALSIYLLFNYINNPSKKI